MIFDANELASAVFFFDDQGRVCKQLHISEFEAVVDGFVALNDLRAQEARCAYAEIDNGLNVRRLVFFRLPINDSGEILKAWGLPLADLAAEGAKSRDLGAGPVLMACYSKCPIPHLRRALWDPELSPNNNMLLALKRAAAENSIGLQFREAEHRPGAEVGADERLRLEQELSTRLRKEYDKDLRDRMAQLLKEQRLRIATMNSEFEKRSLIMRRDFELESEALKQQLHVKEQALAQALNQKQELSEDLASQADKLSAVREYFTRKIDEARGSEEDNIQVLRHSLEAEYRARYEGRNRELQEALQAKELELLYRNEMEDQLQCELARLRQEREQVLTDSGEQILNRILESGLSLVSFQPGLTNMSVPINELADYLDDPEAYAAGQCGVSPELYEAWLEHYRLPVCRNTLDDATLCGENIDRIENPMDFTVGESDCCSKCRAQLKRSQLKLASS
ncbi:sodium:proton antiporter [Agaribacterium haliotis]|uniref:sodium:proton antiporter n=1 Tax=Agaribacterium haliotis TaxID=2013869 RepID=UPI000BB57B66|nr:sodium:proton antiporter [Agaribacterium haliotis]